MKKQSSHSHRAMMEPLEDRQLLSTSSHHAISVTRLTFTTSAASGTIADPIGISVAAKLTANGLPLRTASIYFVVDGKDELGSGTTGRSGYVTLTIPNIYAGNHVIAAYFTGAERYKASNSAAKSVTISVPSLTTTSDGLQYATVSAGSGAVAASGETANVDYAGYLTTGSLFDTSLQAGRTPLAVTLDSGDVIAGFNEGIKGMQVGETRLLVIPSSLGYGSTANGNIPANSTLIFFVKLDSISS